MMFNSPGLTRANEPTLSRCSTSPASSQETVCNPMCGWGGTTMGVLSGP
ncbi:MAG: hypothetical protein V9E82_07900 [Candidatus Nanopelagicales bacterium]